MVTIKVMVGGVGGVPRHTITWWWVMEGRSCRQGPQCLQKVLEQPLPLLSITEGGTVLQTISLCPPPGNLHQTPQQPINLLHQFGATKIMTPPTPLILRNEGKVVWRGTSDHLETARAFPLHSHASISHLINTVVVRSSDWT